MSKSPLLMVVAMQPHVFNTLLALRLLFLRVGMAQNELAFGAAVQHKLPVRHESTVCCAPSGRVHANKVLLVWEKTA